MNKDEIFEILYGKEKVEVYRKFQEIEKQIEASNFLYKYFENIAKMLESDKSYIRVRGFKLIAKLAKWDIENKIKNIIPLLINELDDEKPTAIRQCLACVNTLLEYKPEYRKIINSKLVSIDYTRYKDSMAPLIKKDVDSILK